MENKPKIRIAVAIFMVLPLLVFLAISITKVNINYDLSDYLDDSADTRIALDIINNEFEATTDIKAMIKDIDAETAQNIAAELESIDNVLAVSFDPSSPDHYKDGTALFTVMVKGSDYLPETGEVIDNIKSLLTQRFGENAVYGGSAVDNQTMREAITEEMKWILLISISLVIAVLLIIASSWLEPVLLLLSAGLAVFINLGTNIFLGEISYITNSVAAILQLALSIDYSIILLHTYRLKEKEYDDKKTAMKETVRSIISPVSASSLTTIAGLAALLFMSFKIGFDIGIVLIKGIILSAVVSVTFMPFLVLKAQKLLDKTTKKGLKFSGKSFLSVSQRFGKVILPLFLVLVIACGVIQVNTSYSFTTGISKESEITKTFGENSVMVLVYENGINNDAKEIEFVNKLSQLKKEDGKPFLTGYTAASNTLNTEYTPQAVAELLNTPAEQAERLFALYHLYARPDSLELTISEFFDLSLNLAENDPEIQLLMDETLRSQLKDISAMRDNPLFAAYFENKTAYSFSGLYSKLNPVIRQFGLNITEDMFAGIYLKSALNNGSADTSPVKASELIGFLSDNIEDNSILNSYLTIHQKTKIQVVTRQYEGALSMFKSKEHSRMLLSVDIDSDNDEIDGFMESISEITHSVFGESAHLAGTVAVTHDLKNAFIRDNAFISVFTILSIFIIVMLIFRSLSLPLILITVIQGAIWLMMTVFCLAGQDIFFMSYIIATCILMGATIDYGILMSSNYVRLRQTLDKKEAIAQALAASLPTVFTSGTILTLAGIVIHFISSQNVISSVGLLVGIGALISTLFIVFVLPAILTLLDKYVLKLTKIRKQ